jgi:hypothetical protein
LWRTAQGLAKLGGRGLDHVRVDGALSEVRNSLKLGRFPLEHFDEGLANDLPLALRIAFPGQLAQELLFRIHANNVQGEAVISGLAEGLHDLIAFLQAKQAVIDENTDELIADRAVQQGRHHGGIHAAGEAQQDLPRPHLLAHGLDGVVHDIGGGPAPQGLALIDLLRVTLATMPRSMLCIASNCRRTIQRFDKANSACSRAAFFARPRYRTLVKPNCRLMTRNGQHRA